MKYRTRTFYTDNQKSEMWDRWQRGESMRYIRVHAVGTIAGAKILEVDIRLDWAFQDVLALTEVCFARI